MILKNDLFTFLHYLHLGVLVVELLHAFSSSAGAASAGGDAPAGGSSSPIGT